MAPMGRPPHLPSMHDKEPDYSYANGRVGPVRNVWVKSRSLSQGRLHYGKTRTVVQEFLHAIKGWQQPHCVAKNVVRYLARKNHSTGLKQRTLHLSSHTG